MQRRCWHDGIEHDAERIFPDAANDEKNGKVPENGGAHGRAVYRECCGGRITACGRNLECLKYLLTHLLADLFSKKDNYDNQLRS